MAPADENPHNGGPFVEKPRQGRLLAIGDIHGCAKPMRALLDAILPQPEDTLVILGDFINRGPATREVLEVLLQVGQQCELIVILGNHEEELLAARQDVRSFHQWLAMGGAATLASYGVDTQSSKSEDEWALSESGGPKLGPCILKIIPIEHWQIVEQARAYWECGNYFFTHAGYDPDLPLDKQSPTELRWLALSDWSVRPHCSGKTAIVGHTPNLSGRIVDFGFLRCLDTGCGLGGRLTAMDILSGHQWHCPEDSEKVVWE